MLLWPDHGSHFERPRRPRARIRKSARALVTLLALLFALTQAACDSKKNPGDDAIQQALCTTLAACGDTRGTQFAMIGDSWTDFAVGLPLIHTLRDHLVDTHGFHLTTATLAGQRVDRALAQRLHYAAIDQAGPQLRYVLLSLGGNDMIFTPADFAANPEAERARVIEIIRQNLLTFVREGNAYKKHKHGGADLVWFIHGYDYSNPDNPFSAGGVSSLTGCRSSLISQGFTDEQVTTEVPKNLNAFNAMLQQATSEEPSLRYIDLRGTLGGPPTAAAEHMFDCIHPTSLGFAALAARFASGVDVWTGGAR